MEYYCHRCRKYSEYVLSFSGKHVKQSCGNCRAYIKFLNQSELPSFIDSKNKIWAKLNDLETIEKIKTEMGVFHNDLTVLQKRVYYHNLYVKVVNLLNTGEI